MKRLLSYLKPHKWVMTLATVLVIELFILFRDEQNTLIQK